MKRAFLFLAVLLFAITTEVIAANGVLGPHPMTYEAATPSGYGKVVVLQIQNIPEDGLNSHLKQVVKI